MSARPSAHSLRSGTTRRAPSRASVARRKSLRRRRAAIVLVAQRADVEEIRPHPVDPDFALALAEAKGAGVIVRGVAFHVGLEGFQFAGMRPVVVG